MSLVAPRRAMRSALRAVAALVLAAAAVLGAGAPAHAVESWTVTSPAPGATVTGPSNISVAVSANGLQQADDVQVRLLRGGAQVGSVRGLAHMGGERTGGSSSWSTTLDPLRSWAADGQAMANGIYTVQSRITWSDPTGQQVTGWSGHDAVFDVAPPATSVSTRILDIGGRSVEVRWTAVAVPDFRRYAVQRATGGAGYIEVASVSPATATRFLDATPGPGTHRYRVVVARAGADGRDRTSTSGESSITLEEQASPQPEVPDEQPDAPGRSPSPTAPPSPTFPTAEDGGFADPGDTPGGGDSGGQAAPRTSGSVPSNGAAVPGLRSDSEVPQIVPDTAAAPQISMDDDVFSEELPFPEAGPTEGGEQREIVELDDRELGLAEPSIRRGDLDGGTLSIHDRQLELQQVLPPLAGGLLMFVVGGHLLHLRSRASR